MMTSENVREKRLSGRKRRAVRTISDARGKAPCARTSTGSAVKTRIGQSIRIQGPALRKELMNWDFPPPAVPSCCREVSVSIRFGSREGDPVYACKLSRPTFIAVLIPALYTGRRLEDRKSTRLNS